MYRVGIGAVLTGLLAAAAPGQVASFQGLGTRGAAGVPIAPGSYATGVSSDGAVVCGGMYLWDSYHEIGLASGMRWDRLSGWDQPQPGWRYAVSADGSSTAGYAHLGLAIIVPYLERHGVSIPTGGMGGEEYFTGVSADGMVAAGTYGAGAARWTQEGGPQDLGHLLGGDVARATGISADGGVIVGYDRQPAQTQAFLWSQGSGMMGIGFLGTAPGHAPVSHALAVSADGLVVVGWSSTSTGATQAFLWKASTGIQPLPLLAGYTGGEALAASGDGSVIVGAATVGQTGRVAYYWDRARGRRELRPFLIGMGATGLNGWMLREATGISPDGAFIVGNGVNPQGLNEAWLAHIPAFCYANCDGSIAAPLLNAMDFGCFLNRFAAGDPYANCDGSTVPPGLNVVDFICFLNAFAAGCP